MKRWFIAALAVLLLGALLVAAIERDPGYILISYGSYSLETSLWIGVGALLLLVWLLYLVSRLLGGGLRLGLGRGWLRQRRERRGQRRANEGLIAFVEGNWSRARRLLERAAPQTDQPLMHYLVAARASNALGDTKATQALLARAEGEVPEAAIAVEITQAELLLENGQLEESLATLQRARRNAGRHPYALRLLQRVYLGLKDWTHLIELLPELKRHQLLPPEQLAELEREAYRAQLEVLAARHGEEADRALQQFWRSMPKALARRGDMVLLQARLLAERGAAGEAEALVRAQLKRSWDRELVDLYGRIDGPDPQRQLLAAEQWLPERNNDATLLRSLGRLSLRNQLWGKARDYFESSLRLEDSAETCAELGRLLAHLGEPGLSNEYFRRGLGLSTGGLPELPMPSRHRVA